MTKINTVTVFVDKIQGEVATSAKGSKFLKQGTATVQVRGKAETFRVNFFGVDESDLGKGALLQLDLELSSYEDKVYTQLSVRKITHALSSENTARLTGVVKGFKEFNKVLSVELEIEGKDREGKAITGIQKVTVFDKDSAVAQSLKANKGKEVLIEATFAPSKGFADYTVVRATPVGGGAGVGDVELSTGGLDAAPAPVDDFDL